MTAPAPASCAPPAPSGAEPGLSAELFVIPLSAEGGEPRRFLVYAPLRQAAFVANARTVNLIADLQAGVGSPELAAAGELMEFLRRLEMVGAGPEPRPVTEFSGEPRPTAVTLFLTTACNLRCTYCYASAGDTPLRAMPLAVARRGIDFVLGNALARGAPGIEVSYHGGGEPTANWRTLTESFAYAEERAAAAGLALESSTATNAVLSEAQIDWIVAHLDGASVSCDGLPEAHDRHRPMVSGQGSSARVAHTLRRFDAAGFPYGVRVTVTADQIARLPESIEYLCTQFRTPRIQVEPAYQMGRWENAPSAETEGFIAAYREAQACAARHGRELSYSAARVGVLTNHFCGITQDSFSLSPDGNVSACHEVFSEENRWADVFFYGRPATAGSGYAFDVARLAHLRAQGVQHRAYCRGCFAKWTCAGDCYHKAIGVSGSTEFRGSDRCHITRELTKDQVLARIAAAGGLFWHEPPGAAERPAGKELFL